MMQVIHLDCVESHNSFRVLLQSMSRPGKVFNLPTPPVDDHDSLVDVLKAILDPQVSYCLLEEDQRLEEQVQFQTGARLTTPEQADFLIASAGCSHGKLSLAKRGRLEFPNEGATIVYVVERLSEESADGVELTGPGIKDKTRIKIEGLAAGELKELKHVNREFPLGVDSIYLDRSGRLTSIPRSTKIGGH
jgi:alpha-D-ribose 1-methylphosphonate 5-triphosphate synthase subunit PhnH